MNHPPSTAGDLTPAPDAAAGAPGITKPDAALFTAGQIASETGASAYGIRKAAERLKIKPCLVAGPAHKPISYYDAVAAATLIREVQPRPQHGKDAATRNR